MVVAQTSLIGSIFANALLVLGLVIVAGTIRAPDGCMRFRPRLPQDTATLLFVSIFVIVIVGLSVASSDKASHHIEAISTVGAICLLVVYAAWLWRYLRLGSITAGGRRRGDSAANLDGVRDRPARDRRHRGGVRL